MAESGGGGDAAPAADLCVRRHVKYFEMCLQSLPQPYSNLDSSRMTLAYFALSALDVLGALDAYLAKRPRDEIVDWVYNLQVLQPLAGLEATAGFRGGTAFGRPFHGKERGDDAAAEAPSEYDQGHLAMTYTALCLLRILGDDLSAIRRDAIVAGMRQLQQPNGSFSPVAGKCESDMRFLFCAAAVSTLLDDWSGIDRDAAVGYILASQSFDGAFGQGPGLESHGGSTYCAIAALKLMGRLDELPRRDALVRWCLFRQVGGFQGRLGKVPDTCYSFWIGATLAMLGETHLTDAASMREFSCKCLSPFGGFSKVPDAHPDLLHAYMALQGLSIVGEPGIARVVCELGITERAAQGLGLK